MKSLFKIIPLLSLLFATEFAMGAAAPQPAPVNGYISLGGGNTTAVIVPPAVVTNDKNPLGWFIVRNRPGATAGNVSPLYKNGVAWQVGAGGGAFCISAYGLTDAANVSWQVMYATASYAFDATVGSLTGPIYETGASAQYPHVYYSLVPSQEPVGFTFPASSFPGLQAGASVRIHLTCRQL